VLLGHLDLLALLFSAQQLPHRILILIFELARLEISGLGVHDVRGQIEHVLRYLLVRNIPEIVPLV
jgi:hypothetical protein